MSKTLRTAAIVVGAAALIATGVGAAVGAGVATAAGSAGIGTLSIATVASTASAVSAGLSLAAGVSAPKGTVGGNATKFKIDKDAGLPLVFGRTYVGGNVGHRQYYNDPGSRMKNQRESWVTILSLGPVNSVGPLLVDKTPVSFTSGGSAIGTYSGNMWLDTQLGACPEARALQGPNGDFPGWNATSKLSGLAADLWTLDFDSKGKKFPNGVPQRGRVVEGVFAWDPRLDDTWPGGIGPCRRDDPDTWVYTECPWLLGLQFALGYFQNGFLMAGGGMAVTGIDVQTIVSAANVSDANGWKAGGQVYATTDNSWDILQMLAQAGGGEFLNVGGMLTCTYSAPRPSIGTITSADIAGTIDTPSASSRRKRRNIFIPSVRLESHGWEVVPLDAVKIDEYIEADGAPRPKADVLRPVPLQKQQPAVVTIDDARELLAAIAAVPATPILHLAVEFLALTGVRSAALRGARWDEIEGIDWEGRRIGPELPIWRIPAARMKLSRAKKADARFDHVVTLSRQAVDVLRAARKNSGGVAIVFPGRDGRSPIGAAAFHDLHVRAGYAGRHVPHGWRATFSTIMNTRAPADRHVIDQALAHSPDDKVEAAYNRAGHYARRRVIMQEWADLMQPGRPHAGS